MQTRMPLLLLLLSLFSCGLLTQIEGGKAVERDYQVEKYLVTYSGDRIHLVMDQGRLAVLERDQSRRAALYFHHSRMEGRDYFLTWADGGNGPAIEIIVPVDRTQPAEFYNYRQGQYKIEYMDGTSRLIPVGGKPSGYKLSPIKYY